MWGVNFDELPESIKTRVPKNTNLKSEYFIGDIQCLPKNGYTRMMENMFMQSLTENYS
jgi:UDP-galactopyranose mutase